MGLNALEALALNTLPEKARISRIISWYRRGKLGAGNNWRAMKQREAKRIISMTEEPRGRKGWMVGALITEHARQIKVVRDRPSSAGSDISEINAAHKRRISNVESDSERKRLEKNHQEHKRTRLASKLLQTHRRGLLPSRAASYWWGGRSSGSNYHFQDVAYSKGNLYVVVRPSSWRQNNGIPLKEHKVLFLIVKEKGQAPLAVRIQHECLTVKSAIKCLERALTKKAREKGYKISIDWSKRCFVTRAPIRNRTREIPFMRWERKERS